METISGQEQADRHARQSQVGEGIAKEVPTSVSAWTIDGTRVALRIDLAIYTIEAVLRACYKFTDRCYVFVDRASGSLEHLLVVLTSKTHGTELSPVVGDFVNEVLDQRIRASLDAEFGVLRTLVVAQAFSEGNLLTPTDDGRHPESAR
jgi:His-Xaa-Ser system protein HxsD